MAAHFCTQSKFQQFIIINSLAKVTVPIREEFDKVAKQLGWEKPEELGEKILLDFMESVTRKSYRTIQNDVEDI